MSDHDPIDEQLAEMLGGRASAPPGGSGAVLTAVLDRASMIRRRRAIKEVLPGTTLSAAFQLGEDGTFEPVPSNIDGAELVYAGYDHDHSLVGLAMVAQGRGYQDVIRILFGYSFE